MGLENLSSVFNNISENVTFSKKFSSVFNDISENVVEPAPI